MRILLSNDDGYLAPGLACLEHALRPHAEVFVVAPDRDRSGASNSLTLRSPLQVRTADNGFHYVDGTPTDCVHLAITGLMGEEPDMVIAGINGGANLGDDVIYSGTVAAATEGRFLGFPAVAVSLVGTQCKYYDTAAEVVLQVMNKLRQQPLSSDAILNINVPDLPAGELAGFQATRLGHRHKSEPVVRAKNPQGEEVYWVGPPGAEQDAGPGTDFHAIRENFVSVTPLQVDLTRHATLQEIDAWLQVATP
ncbi:MAG: 5'/3'-nucleotidase SurE [Gammaproteobacteria bacterium]|nr:5'/3'-nucleotidase SurE [Gammaproteobacteria bacterium]